MSEFKNFVSASQYTALRGNGDADADFALEALSVTVYDDAPLLPQEILDLLPNDLGERINEENNTDFRALTDPDDIHDLVASLHTAVEIVVPGEKPQLLFKNNAHDGRIYLTIQYSVENKLGTEEGFENLKKAFEAAAAFAEEEADRQASLNTGHYL